MIIDKSMFDTKVMPAYFKAAPLSCASSNSWTIITGDVAKNSSLVFFQRYLKVAPLSHALWRSVEAQELEKHELKKPVLDIGCGFGEFGGVFFSSQVEVGIDLDQKEILKAAKTGKYQKTVVADARKLPFKDESFNTVISISTLEHIPNNFKVFKEAYRVLRPGGHFIFTVPTQKLFDGLLLVKVLKFLRLRNIAHIYFRILNKAFKHVFIPDEKIWISQVKKAGFQLQEVKGTISQIILILWELGLITALPSQLSKILTGKRLTMLGDFKAIVFKPLASLIKSSSEFRANIIVIAKKPTK